MNLGYALLGATLFLIACGPSSEDMRVMVNKAVEEESVKLMQVVVEEARKNPGPAGERGEQGERGERGPAVADERLAQMVQAALATVELPVGPQGPTGERGEQGKPGPEVSDERVAQAVQAALATLELPVGPPGPKGDPGEPGAPAEIPPELMEQRFNMVELPHGCCGVQFFDENGVARVELDAHEDGDLTGIEFRGPADDYRGGIWVLETTMILIAPDGTALCIDEKGVAECGNLFEPPDR